MSQLLALTSAAFYGLGDFVGGFATRRMALWRVTAWSMFIGIAVLIVGLFVVIWKWSSLAARGRVLSIVLLSVLWHGIGAALWLLILNGLN